MPYIRRKSKADSTLAMIFMIVLISVFVAFIASSI